MLTHDQLLERASSVRAVFFDNEGCLVPDRRRAWKLRELHRVAAWLHRRGPDFRFALSTGRSVPYAEAVLHAIGRMNSPFESVCEGGAVLYTPGTDLVIRPDALGVAPEQRPPLQPCVDLDEIVRLIAEGGFGSPESNEYHVEPGKFSCVSIHPRDLKRLDELETVLTSGLTGRAIHVAASSAAVDLTSSGQDKGWAIDHILSRYGISWEEVLVMGDRNNDVAALERAGLAVCPQDCDKGVLDVCHVQMKLPDTQAALAALKLLDGKLPGPRKKRDIKMLERANVGGGSA